MSAFLHSVASVVALELGYRVRRISWYVLIGVFFALLALGTVLVYLIVGLTNGATGAAFYSGIIYVVAILSVLFIPALSGGALNNDREAGRFADLHRRAPTRSTLATEGQVVIGTFLAAWLSTLAFLITALPALAYAAFTADQMPAGIPIDPSLIVLAPMLLVFHFGIVAALGVGFSGIFGRPLYSIAASYLVSLCVAGATLIAWLLAVAFQPDTDPHIPEWAIGIGAHFLLSVGSLYWAYRRASVLGRTNAPAASQAVAPRLRHPANLRP